MLPNGWSNGSVGIGAAGGAYICCRLCRRGDSCCDDNDVFCEREEKNKEAKVEEEIKKNQKETKGLRSWVRRKKDEADGNVVVFVRFCAEF